MLLLPAVSMWFTCTWRWMLPSCEFTSCYCVFITTGELNSHFRFHKDFEFCSRKKKKCSNWLPASFALCLVTQTARLVLWASHGCEVHVYFKTKKIVLFYYFKGPSWHTSHFQCYQYMPALVRSRGCQSALQCLAVDTALVNGVTLWSLLKKAKRECAPSIHDLSVMLVNMCVLTWLVRAFWYMHQNVFT